MEFDGSGNRRAGDYFPKFYHFTNIHSGRGTDTSFVTPQFSGGGSNTSYLDRFNFFGPTLQQGTRARGPFCGITKKVAAAV